MRFKTWSARRQLLTFMAGILISGLLLATPASSLEPWRLVVRIEGRVESRKPGQENWSPIFRSRLLSDGDYARTLRDSRGAIKLADQSEFTIGADTVVEMTKFVLTPEGRTVVFNLEVGKIRARVAKRFGIQSKFEVKTPNGVLAARGTEFYAELAPGQDKASGAGGPGMLASLPSDLLTASLPVVDSGSTDMNHDVVAQGPVSGGVRLFLVVFSGRVNATTPLGQRLFNAGDFGTIDARGTIRFNPPVFQPPSASGGTRGRDADMSRARPVETTQGGQPPSDPMHSQPGAGTQQSSPTGGPARVTPPVIPPNQPPADSTRAPNPSRPSGTIPIIIR